MLLLWFTPCLWVSGKFISLFNLIQLYLWQWFSGIHFLLTDSSPTFEPPVSGQCGAEHWLGPFGGVHMWAQLHSRARVQARISVETGHVEVTWLNQKLLAKWNFLSPLFSLWNRAPLEGRVRVGNTPFTGDMAVGGCLRHRRGFRRGTSLSVGFADWKGEGSESYRTQDSSTDCLSAYRLLGEHTQNSVRSCRIDPLLFKCTCASTGRPDTA